MRLHVNLSKAVAHWEPEEAPPDSVPCCYGAVNGPRYCTCWEPVYDLEQREPVSHDLVSGRRAEMCHDCAYRPDSPERRENGDAILELPIAGQPFYCHQGMRKVVRWEHPDGRVHVPDRDDYHPPILNGDVPLCADGTAAALCEGWRRLAVKAARSEASS